ncbi:hypothetical protein C5167_021301 [Papaver somniferum]|uniref:BACK domain-containing protein n=1 Tax=Papaver somniferum TaxID=3469 RepID=A0A4Y7IZF5_PAPSO|nr:hypothetical protein C5167_021301 [Papaver somniferum]
MRIKAATISGFPLEPATRRTFFLQAVAPHSQSERKDISTKNNVFITDSQGFQARKKGVRAPVAAKNKSVNITFFVISAVVVDSNQAYVKVETCGTFVKHFKMSESMISCTTSCRPIFGSTHFRKKAKSWLCVLQLSSVLMVDALQPLTDAVKQYLTERYINITEFSEEVLNLPLAEFETVLSSDDLQCASEDVVYDFVLKWAKLHYPKRRDRCEVLTRNDFDHDLMLKDVLDALFVKAEAAHTQRTLATELSAITNRCFVERAYIYRPVKVVEFELPHQQCVVYLDLKHDECVKLFPSGRVDSQIFHFGGQGLFLSAHCNMDKQSSLNYSGPTLAMQETGSVSFAVYYEFAARSKLSEEYVTKFKRDYTFTARMEVGSRNLFAIPWTNFTAEDSLYFIKGMLHLRAEITFKS